MEQYKLNGRMLNAMTHSVMVTVLWLSVSKHVEGKI